MVSYGEDPSDTMINPRVFNQTFGGLSQPRQLELIEETRESLENIPEGEDSDTILTNNIARANRILDRLEEEILSGELSPRLIETCGQLINAVTTAATSITSNSFGNVELELKAKALEIKEKEIAVKAAIQGAKAGTPQTVNNNLVVMSREEILGMIEGKPQQSEA